MRINRAGKHQAPRQAVALPQSWNEVMRLGAEDLAAVAAAVGVNPTGDMSADRSAVWQAVKAAA